LSGGTNDIRIYSPRKNAFSGRILRNAKRPQILPAILLLPQGKIVMLPHVGATDPSSPRATGKIAVYYDEVTLLTGAVAAALSTM
jgi:hypothetical protein